MNPLIILFIIQSSSLLLILLSHCADDSKQAKRSASKTRQPKNVHHARKG